MGTDFSESYGQIHANYYSLMQCNNRLNIIFTIESKEVTISDDKICYFSFSPSVNIALC